MSIVGQRLSRSRNERSGGVISNGWPVMGYFPEVSRMPSRLDSTIANQEEHHERILFQDEFRALCQRRGIALDQRYAWD